MRPCLLALLLFVAAPCAAMSEETVMGVLESPADAAQDAAALDQSLALAQRGQVDLAIDLLRAHLDQRGNDQQGRVLLGHLLLFQGAAEGAVEVWSEGLSGDESDLEFLLLLGDLAFQRAQDGPYVQRTGATIAYHPNDGSEDETAWGQRQLDRAVDAYGRAWELAPDDVAIGTRLAGALLLAGKAVEALSLLQGQVAAHPDEVDAWLQLAWAHEELADLASARASYEQALVLEPHLPATWWALERLLEEAGATEEAAEHRKHAIYYDYLAVLDAPPYTEERRALVEVLADEHDPDAAADIRQARRLAVIEDLLAADSEEALVFLAAFCWHHTDHGALEDRAYEALVTAGAAAVPLLLALVESAESTCTIRQSCLALARLKAPGTLDMLLEWLPGDTRAFFSMDIAGALSVLGDPAAVPALVELAAVDWQAPPAEGDDPMMSSLGRLMARQRAVLALGTLGTADAVAALQVAVANPDLALHAQAALARSVGSRAHRKAVLQRHQQDPDYGTWGLLDYLGRGGDKKAARLAAAWSAGQEGVE